MRRTTLYLIFLFTFHVSTAQTSAWKPVEGRIATPWAAQVNPQAALPEYPRPQMVRESWLNLNGLWDYAIRPEGTSEVQSFDGQILVPFAVESSLSGVGKTVGKASVLGYRRSVTLPSGFRNKKVLLHFGAVDWKCEVRVNGKVVGSHTGGY